MAARSFEYFALNFPTPLVLAAPLGVWLGWKQPATRWFVAVAAAIFAVGSVFAFRYQVPDQYVFFMPCYVLVPLLAGLAIPWLTAKGRFLPAICLLCAVMPAAVYEAAPPLLKRMTVNLPTRNIPYRDTYGYFIRPRKNGDDGAQRFAREALARAGPDGLLLADSTIGHVLTYVRDVEGVERNVVLSGSEMRSAPPRIPPDDAAAIHRFAERGRAFICSASPGYVPPWIKAEYDLVPVDVIFRLVPKPSRPKPSSQDAPD